ncbi:MAG: CoA transferase subunit A [Pedobacter sp.]|nr:MAG: CoA transferase subunit A [Pedobacter sp.]
MINKVVANAKVAIQDIKDGDTLMLGGFGLCGIPENCINALVEKGVAKLTCISNNAGVDARCLAAGYGMPAIFTPAGVGTEVAEGKEVRNFDGKDYLMEYAFDADFAIVKAWKGDTAGNLIYRSTSRNFNPLMAMAGKITIAEVEELVEAGELDPDHIHTPGVYVHRIFQGVDYEKRIEQRTVTPKS